MAVGLVIVSHSARLAEGVVELAGQMSRGHVRLVAAGGTDDGALGTSLAKVLHAIESADVSDASGASDGVLVLVDLGSAGLVAEMALEQLPERRRARVRLCDAPLVEGAVVAAIEASVGSTLEQVAATAQDAVHLKKIAKRM
jgi:dihydroxyacetone kinase phosphotransfer subunit